MAEVDFDVSLEEERDGGDNVEKMEDSKELEGGEKTTQPKKRGRGRPRKNPDAPPKPKVPKRQQTKKAPAKEDGDTEEEEKDEPEVDIESVQTGQASPVKRGRGRPKKDPNAPPAAKTGKVGRPKKVATTEDSDGEPVQKRGRGRPRKNPKADSGPKRPRGRPRKNPDPSADEEEGVTEEEEGVPEE